MNKDAEGRWKVETSESNWKCESIALRFAVSSPIAPAAHLTLRRPSQSLLRQNHFVIYKESLKQLRVDGVDAGSRKARDGGPVVAFVSMVKALLVPVSWRNSTPGVERDA